MIGGDLFTGTSKLVAEPLGVTQMFWKGWNLGRTTEETTLTPEKDLKDIMYQQEGTKAADHVNTGVEYTLKCVFGEIKTSLLRLMEEGFSSENESDSSDSADLNRNIFKSLRDTHNGPLKTVAVDENGTPLETLVSQLNFYEAIPLIDGALINWGADTQRNLTVNFKIKWHRFATGESVAKAGSFGYYGDPVAEDLPPIVWPNVAEPTLLTAIASTAILLTVAFDENIAFQTPFAAEHYSAKVEGVFVAPVSAVITLKEIALTFGAATFTAGDEIEISISDIALEDTETTANLYSGVSGKVVSNTI